MNFKEATDGLLDRIDHAELAKALGVSVASVRQARLNPGANAYRSPPQDWEDVVMNLAEGRLRQYAALIDRLRTHNRKQSTKTATPNSH
jgi:hypothetical protein